MSGTGSGTGSQMLGSSKVGGSQTDAPADGGQPPQDGQNPDMGGGGPPPDAPPPDAPPAEAPPQDAMMPPPGESPASSPDGQTPADFPAATPDTGAPELSASNTQGQKPKSRQGPVDMSNVKIGFIGAGRITEAIIKGLVKYAKIEGNRLHVAAPSTHNLQRLKDTYQLHASKRAFDIFGRYDCDVVFIAFHGKVIRECYKIGTKERPAPFTTNFIPNMHHPTYVLSLVTGVSTSEIKSCMLNPEKRDRYQMEAHRIVVNTAAAYGNGLISVDTNPEDPKRFNPIIKQILSSLGKIERLNNDNELDASCALTGSGLAYAHYFISAMSDAGNKMGLDRKLAERMCARVVQSSCQAMLESGKHPTELRDGAAGAGGAAAHGIHKLDSQNVASGVVGAIEAAFKRAREMAQ